MPGGSSDAWPHVKEILQGISAKAGDGSEPCCQWVGSTGAGHYVKMVHNGIEYARRHASHKCPQPHTSPSHLASLSFPTARYGDMQLICEAYHLMKDALGMTPDEMGDAFTEWNKGELDSYLIEITSQILKFKDTDGTPLVEKIRDTAGQKGTGKWTGIEALEQGMPVTLIGEAVFARCLSALKGQREHASTLLGDGIKKIAQTPEEKKMFIEAIRQALLASKVVSYAQGFMLMAEAAKAYDWKLNYGEISLMWRGGCIIRSTFLGAIKEAFDADPDLPNLLLAPYFVECIKKCEASWRQVVSQAALIGLPTPAFSTALAFFDGYRCKRLPANLLQAQRDYFGAHTFERLDNPGTWEHANWTGNTGRVTASTYLA